ncbi:hypothetical protein Tco_0085275 [Tanacetum coccineum]
MKTPISSDTKLTKDEECESVDSTMYRGMIGTTHLGLWYPKGTGIETVVYANSDHAGYYKQTALAISTTEAEYVSAEKACQQALWMKQALIDYDVLLDDVPIIIPCEGACVFSDRWSLDELVYGAPSEGPYQTNLPSPDDIISYVREDREGQYNRVMTPLAAQQERKPRRDRGTRRGRQSTSSSSTFDQPSSSHLNDDDDDGNDKGTSRASTPSPIRYVNSLTNQVPQVFQNPPNIDLHLEPFYTRQTEIISHQMQLRDEHRGEVKSIGKSLRKLWRNMRK